MPFTLRRSRRRDINPSRSLVDVVKSKISGSVSEPKRDRRICEYIPMLSNIQLTDVDITDRSYLPRHEEIRRPHRITQLPAELLAHIFVMGSEVDVMLPFTVSHVCRAWRQLALRTPALWRRIPIDSRITLWSQRIARSRACLMDIEILPQVLPTPSRPRRHYLDAQTVQLYMHIISPYITQWRSLTIEFQHYAPYLWNAALSACCGFGPAVQAPRLQQLSLVHPHNDDTKEFLLFNGIAPRLRVVTIHGIRLTWLPSLFANLTVLDYTHHGFTRGQDAAFEIFRMLQVCSRRLRELRLAFPHQSTKAIHFYENNLSHKDHIYFEYLHTLTLHVEGADIPSALITLIARLHFRMLRTLTFSAPAPIPSSSHSRLHHEHRPFMPATFSRTRKFLQCLSRLPNLTRLEIAHAWCRPSFVLGILNQHIPRLKYLSLQSAAVDDMLLYSLGETCRERYRVAYPPGGMPYVIYHPLVILEISNAAITKEGFLSVIRRMLACGVIWVGEIWLKDCRAIDTDVVTRAARFGVPVKVWLDEEQLREKDATGGQSAFAWTKRFR